MTVQIGLFSKEVIMKHLILVAKAGQDNYIRCAYSGTATNGAIHRHIEWRALSEIGFVKVVAP